MKSDRFLSVVVPCYNEEDTLSSTIQRLNRVCAIYTDSYELLFVDDGSADGTWKRLSELHCEFPALKAIRLSRNFGHQAALTAGLRLAIGMDILLIDADLQDPPELLPELLLKRAEGYDIVYGRRNARDGESSFKRATAWIFYRVINFFSDIAIPTDTGDFRLMSRRAVNALLQLPERNRFIRGMVAWIGFPQAAVDYRRDARSAGTTKYTFRKMLRLSIDAITGFSIRPLRLAVMLGGAMLVGFAAILTWVLYVWSKHHTILGWTSLLCVILLIGGCQTILLGVMGEYLGRLFIETKQRPLFIIQEQIGFLGLAPNQVGERHVSERGE